MSLNDMDEARKNMISKKREVLVQTNMKRIKDNLSKNCNFLSKLHQANYSPDVPKISNLIEK